ncbi:MAG: A/G-specific adenine glycosylase [Candidatus Yanofskybacteria bacterium]|nr:A/G-specific adenine glycosylase [Candidatus Yanofskybacteria bacterium]
MTIPSFQRHILAWHRKNRRDLPWRNTKDPYKILVSEIMLQQTQVSRVLPKYEEFLRAFPTPKALAKTADAKLLSVWKGLGYWRRARYLKETAFLLQEEFPKIPAQLELLPGIGPYTARALACFAFQHQEAFLDTNIRRVYLHFFFANTTNVSDKEILTIAQKAVWKRNPREWHYALFDYGAIELKDKSINKRSRHYAKQSKFEGSFRSFRTKVVRFLLDQPNQTASSMKIARMLRDAETLYSPGNIVQSLLKDGLIKKKGKSYSL